MYSCPIARAAQNSPQNLAILSDEGAFPYQELDSLIETKRKKLQTLGVKPSHRVAFIASSYVETIILFFALLRLGAILCPLSFRLPPLALQERLAKLKADAFLENHTISSLRHTPSQPLPSAVCCLLFTSGSSAHPKIAALSYDNFLASATGSIPPCHLQEHSRWLLSLPLFHVGGIGILFRCILSHSCIVLSKEKPPRALEQNKITHLSLVPTQLYRLLQEPPAYKTLECILLGGAPIPPELLVQAKKRNFPVFSTYGMTEMSSQITMDQGKVLPFREVQIASDGEILVKGKTLFKGYLQEDMLFLPLIDGWFATKDLGEWDASDNLVIKGRKDLLFISGGENISPEEIERALCSLTGIYLAVVVPIPDEEYGERPFAFIHNTCGTSAEEIRERLLSVLPKFCIPKQIVSLPGDLVENSIKWDRKALRKLALTTLLKS